MTEQKPSEAESKAKRQLKRLEEAREVVGEYADDLRKALDKLGEKLN